MSGSIRDTFFEECEDLLAELAEGLEHFSAEDVASDVVNMVFRAVHSMKGGGAAFGLDDLVGFAHTFETVLDKLRSNTLKMSEPLLEVLFLSGDRLSDLVAAARDGTDIDPVDIQSVAAELSKFLDADIPAAMDTGQDFSFDAITLDFDDPAEAPQCLDQSGLNRFDIYFKPHNALFSNGHEPSLLLEALSQLGTIDVQLIDDELPEFDSLSDVQFGLAWQVQLETIEHETALDPIFEFVEGLCDLKIVQKPLEPTEVSAPTPSTDAPCIASKEVPADYADAKSPPVTSKPVAKPASGPKPTLRVDLERVDKLINAVGELIINQAMIAQQVEKLNLPNGSFVATELEGYKLLAREIQEGVMAIRAQPVKPLFQRMGRIVREAAQETGKKARLVTVGDETEVDKTVVERLADPLTHMIRNAADHGLEPLIDRQAAGKPDIGTITLSASHRSGNVVIEVSDDGAGLNRGKIQDIAISKGLIDPKTELSNSEIDNLLFLPGFSTVSKVSNISGRGVGMDVVKNAVTTLGGRISISSTPGAGTTFTVVLPLTLAVLDGMVVSVADQTMVVPITSIIETVRPSANDLHQLGQDGLVLSIRGTYIPVVSVAEQLNFTTGVHDPHPKVLLIVDTESHGPRALAIDEIYDQRQVVIKSLEGNYGKISGVSAATILGDGQIALILDPESIADLSPTYAPKETFHVA